MAGEGTIERLAEHAVAEQKDSKRSGESMVVLCDCSHYIDHGKPFHMMHPLNAFSPDFPSAPSSQSSAPQSKMP